MIAADYIAHSGDDLLVVNAARVSFAKRSAALSDADRKLIGFLARNGHWTPFSHPQITLHVRAPIFVARQAFKHKVGFTENEVSRRYVDAPPEFYMPPVWRGRAETNKQGSAGAIGAQTYANLTARAAHVAALDAYETLLDRGVAPEQARMVLPVSTITEWFWTGSLAAWARFYALRAAKDAQAETGDLAQVCAEIIAPLFPVCWPVLTGQTDGAPA